VLLLIPHFLHLSSHTSIEIQRSQQKLSLKNPEPPTRPSNLHGISQICWHLSLQASKERTLWGAKARDKELSCVQSIYEWSSIVWARPIKTSNSRIWSHVPPENIGWIHLIWFGCVEHFTTASPLQQESGLVSKIPLIYSSPFSHVISNFHFSDRLHAF
jgi:hypothetical protein